MALIARFGSPFQIAWNVLAFALVLDAVVAVARVPATSFRHGGRTNVFWLLVPVGVLAAFAGYLIPVGAVWSSYVIGPRHRRAVAGASRPS